MSRYTVEPGRQIYRDGRPFLSVSREGETAPHEADAWTRTIAALLNEHDSVAIRPSVELEREDIPADFPVRPLGPTDPAKDRMTCGNCGLSWDDAILTQWTPAPAARCPFEYYHEHDDE